MPSVSDYQLLGWQHELWDVVRYFRSIGKQNKRLTAFWLRYLKNGKSLAVSTEKCSGTFQVKCELPIKQQTIDTFFNYLEDSGTTLKIFLENLRTETEALNYCHTNGVTVAKTKTKLQQHHQSSKSLVSAVSHIALKVTKDLDLDIDTDPQNRSVWLKDNKLLVTSRNLDGAIPALLNPRIVWEIKEYWGITKGGSKMSDAVYECQLVGREIKEYEEKTGIKICHVVFLDGKVQWGHRVSDFVRFIDLYYQGLIDHLIIGKKVESEWENVLREILSA